MEYEDRIAISTPEGIDVEVTLAGVGSRFMAGLVDTLIKAVIILALFIAIGALGSGSGSAAEPSGSDLAVGAAIVTVLAFLVFFFYDVLFETLGGGRTPGKRLTGLRVVRSGGQPVDLRTSAVRNLIREFEGLLTSYVPAIISVLVTRRNQRLGDLAAGTLVVREAPAPASAPPAPPISLTHPPPPPPDPPAWDVSAVSADDLATVRRFLERRASLESAARQRLAEDLAARLRPKVAGVADGDGGERFLEDLAAVKAARG